MGPIRIGSPELSGFGHDEYAFVFPQWDGFSNIEVSTDGSGLSDFDFLYAIVPFSLAFPFGLEIFPTGRNAWRLFNDDHGYEALARRNGNKLSIKVIRKPTLKPSSSSEEEKDTFMTRTDVEKFVNEKLGENKN